MSVQSTNLVAGGLKPVSSSIVDQSGFPRPKLSAEAPAFETKAAPPPDALQNAVDEANKLFSHVRPDIKFVIDESSNEVVIMLVEPDTGDVINRYPTEQALAMSHAFIKTQDQIVERHEAFRNAGDGVLGLFVQQKT